MCSSIFSDRGRVAIGAILAMAPAADALAQCAMCAQSAAGSMVSRGLSLSILFLLGVLVLTVGWLVTLVVRRARAADAMELRKGA